MESVINELKEKKILQKEDIIEIRAYINDTNPDADKMEKASLLSHAVYSIIEKNLEGFSDKYKEQIKRKLITKLLSGGKEFIDKSDILNTCNGLKNNSNEIKHDLVKWINTNVETFINEEAIREYIYSDNRINQVDLNKSNKSKGKKIESIKRSELKSKSSKKFNFIQLGNDFINVISKPVIDTIKILRVINRQNKRIAIFVSLSLILITAFGFAVNNIIFKEEKSTQAFKYTRNNISIENRGNLVMPKDIETPSKENINTEHLSHIPTSLRYRRVNETKLKVYLKSRNSILMEEPYFSAIIDTSREFGLNPIILFAITGQEQGFVSKDHTYAKKIANNPFNVFGSWIKYNTDIKDSSEVAARTVSNLLKGKPEGINPFKWVNRKYAEDKKWWKGVEYFFNDIENALE